MGVVSGIYLYAGDFRIANHVGYSFHASLGIFHGFTASPESGTPSPLLFSAIVTAAAKRYDVALIAPISAWEDLFQKALLRLMYEIRPKTWDDVVGLGIARTWFWKADEITSGMIYGAYLETLSPTLADGGRSRRIWDFLEVSPFVLRQPYSGR